MTENNIPTLPAKMRTKQTSSGKTYYYYDTCSKPRKWLPLGADFLEALRQYAELEQDMGEQSAMPSYIDNTVTFGMIADKYIGKYLLTSDLADRTKRDYLAYIKKLKEFFDMPNNPAPINAITSVDINEYLEWRRDAQTRANREIAMMSILFNYARKFGYTNNANPCTGISKFKESGRDVYISDQDYWRLYDVAERHLQQIMLVAYYIGQRVTDCLNLKVSDINDQELWIQQNKTGQKIRIQIIGGLKDVLEQILAERGNPKHDYLFTNLSSQRHKSEPLSYHMLRGAMDRARQKARIKKNTFQMRDLRAKAATDKDEQYGIEAARILLGHTTQSTTKRYIRNRKGYLTEPSMLEIKRNIKANI